MLQEHMKLLKDILFGGRHCLETTLDFIVHVANKAREEVFKIITHTSEYKFAGQLWWSQWSQ